ncbi:MAG: molybdopterin molybdotransferase MoeA [Geothrix sp.]|uniref:molybdopterin molybdotransferase MoeA n=1 Tax=Geothrix sp. TaxID=1962974 RepID=UPI00185633A7|nr:molybdopterin molybdotransferase MoeA [Geothrix sp.]NWJ40848.1 molybdopterin molybdotransferase MoeA [Geothrix sp.]WIL21151.1 MAG: molybdopterin molybdotransferase MoeA [Geothrix sp.]
MAMSCDHPDLLPLEEALQRLWEALPAPSLPEVRAERDDPATDRASMDGIALKASEGRAPRRILGTLFAGSDPAAFTVTPGTAVRIMTGAALPAGADAIVPVEQLEPVGGLVLPAIDPTSGDHVRRQGDQARGGDLLLPAGTPFNAARIALLAQEGQPMPARSRIRVGVASTGDELVPSPAPHQIRDSNGPMLAALAHILGAEVDLRPALADDPATLAAALRNPGDIRILLTSGGVSMGDHDHLPAVLRDLGATVLFHRIRLKPGKPMLAALLGDLLVLGLPGNPVSAYLNALLFLRPALARLEGRDAPDPWRRGRLSAPVKHKGDRPLLHPCRLVEGRLEPLPGKGSADLITLARADGFAWIDSPGQEAGAKVRWLPVI